MRMIVQRFIAVILLVIPGAIATYGFLAMKDVLFIYIAQIGEETGTAKFNILKFLWGLICFIAGTGFIGGWIFFRDRKRNYVAPRFIKRENND